MSTQCSTSVWAECGTCGNDGELSLPEPSGQYGLLACPACGDPIRTIDVSSFDSWIEEQVEAKRQRQESGSLGTRKQSSHQSDTDIDRDGLAAEAAACVLVCPGKFNEWQSQQGPNRGRDLPEEWTGLAKPCEVKQTRYKDANRGYLLVRPPRMTPGGFREEYIDDSIYLLLCGGALAFEIVGWIDRQGLLERGRLNPVPVRQGQRECWGVHWSRLFPMSDLFAQYGALCDESKRKGKRSPTLKQELEAAGYRDDAACFRGIVISLFGGHYQHWTDEDLLFHPNEATRFCKLVRSEIGVQVSDNLILRTLVNIRKSKPEMRLPATYV